MWLCRLDQNHHYVRINIEFQAGVIRENMGANGFVGITIYDLRFCFVISICQIKSLVSLPYAYNNNCSREISKLWNVILLNIIREPCWKSFSGFFFYEIGMFTNTKWICYRNNQKHRFKFQGGNEMHTILFFVGKISGHARVLL